MRVVATLAETPNLRPALTVPIRWDLIAQQYDPMIKYATAIRLGTATTEAILRRFTKALPVRWCGRCLCGSAISVGPLPGRRGLTCGVT
jgi:hypothetical protein